MRWCLLLGLWLISPLAWGQTPPVSPGKATEPAVRHFDRRVAGDSLATDRPQKQVLQEPNQSRINENQPLHQQLRRLQIPKQVQANMPVLLFFSAVLGALLFISLFTVAQYLLNHNPSYGWYALYLTTMTMWLWQAISIWFDVIPRPSNPTFFFTLLLVLDYGTMMSYPRFLSYFLDVPQQQPRLERWLHYFFWYLAIVMLASLAELLLWNSLHLYAATGLINYGGLLMLIVGMLRSRHPLKGYALAGSILLLSGAFISLFLNYNGPIPTDQLNRMPLFYMSVTTLLQILCFSLALGRRSYLNKMEKIQAQQQLIQQLEENGRLQHSHTIELKNQLVQRETEVLTKAHELEEQRISQLRSNFERRAAECEMAGLRSQMNPHFIFNCLNSIKLYATENDSGKASDYLTKFSRLIRMVLENSRSERVTLQNELDMLQLYADMEIMRFKQKLSFCVDIEPGLDAGFVEIPPLLLQPYVENAIWHGLMHKPEGGTVRIRATLPQENRLQLTITDDGVGRIRAAELRSKSASHRKSFGLKMTSERIALVNQLYQTHTQVTIDDLVDANGQPAGTEVVLQIPI